MSLSLSTHKLNVPLTAHTQTQCHSHCTHGWLASNCPSLDKPGMIPIQWRAQIQSLCPFAGLIRSQGGGPSSNQIHQEASNRTTRHDPISDAQEPPYEYRCGSGDNGYGSGYNEMASFTSSPVTCTPHGHTHPAVQKTWSPQPGKNPLRANVGGELGRSSMCVFVCAIQIGHRCICLCVCVCVCNSSKSSMYLFSSTRARVYVCARASIVELTRRLQPG